VDWDEENSRTVGTGIWVASLPSESNQSVRLAHLESHDNAAKKEVQENTMSDPSFTIAATFFNEVNALPGFLEAAAQFADELLLVDCGPNAAPSTDGSLDILRKWSIEPLRWKIDAGYGSVRTQLLHTCKTPWAIIMDIDERLLVASLVLRCEGAESYPQVPHPNLKVTSDGSCYNHREFLLGKMRDADHQGFTGVRFQRRHWFDATYTKPTQNWELNKDWQLRCLRTHKHIGYKSETRMHEHAWDSRRNDGPRYMQDDPMFGPVFQHLHCHFKPMEPEQRQQDIKIYDALHFGKTEQVWKELGYL
jgi:hypothetical protein